MAAVRIHVSSTQVLVEGFMIIWRQGRPAALIDASGKIFWRDESFPVYLIENLIEQLKYETAPWN